MKVVGMMTCGKTTMATVVTGETGAFQLNLCNEELEVTTLAEGKVSAEEVFEYFDKPDHLQWMIDMHQQSIYPFVIEQKIDLVKLYHWAVVEGNLKFKENVQVELGKETFLITHMGNHILMEELNYLGNDAILYFDDYMVFCGDTVEKTKECPDCKEMEDSGLHRDYEMEPSPLGVQCSCYRHWE